VPIPRARQHTENKWHSLQSRAGGHQKNADPNVAVRLHDSIRRRLNQGATEPVLIASEALKDLELNGQVDNDEPHQLASLVGTAEFVAH